jgi:hypothetical protein
MLVLNLLWFRNVDTNRRGMNDSEITMSLATFPVANMSLCVLFLWQHEVENHTDDG